MSVSRRDFLASSVALGAAAALAPREGTASFFGTPGVDTPVRILRSAHDPSEAFEQASRAALQAAGVASVQSLALPAAPDFARWQALVSQAEGAVLVGMVSEAEFVFVNELVREKGGRFLCRGTHLAGDESHSRHAFTTTGSSAGLGAAFASQLQLAEHHALVQEEAWIEGAPSTRPAPERAPARGDWSALLGSALAEVAVGRWRPAAIESRTRVGRGDDFKVARSSWVSFVAAV